MSNSPNQYSPFEFQPEIKKSPFEPQPSNSMGVAGFVLSIVGIVTCGTLSILGVIFSAIGLGKEPKGFAIAGLVIGLVGIVELVCAVFMWILVTRTVDSVKTIAGQAMVHVEMQQIAVEIGRQWESTKQLPSQTQGDLIVQEKRNFPNTTILYETKEDTFSLRNAGTDGQPHTDDDIVSGPYTFDDATRLVKQFDESSEYDGFEDEMENEGLGNEMENEDSSDFEDE